MVDADPTRHFATVSLSLQTYSLRRPVTRTSRVLGMPIRCLSATSPERLRRRPARQSATKSSISTSVNFRQNGLYFVVGRPGTYKSWQLIKSAAEALQQERNATIFSLEMTDKELQDRLICMLAGVSWPKFEHRALMPADKKLLTEAAEWLHDYSHQIRIIHPPMGERTVAHLRQQALDHEASMVYIDQLSFIDSARKWNSNWEKVGSICYELKDAAADFPIVVAAQFNRQCAGIKEMGDLEHIGLADAVGQSADMVFGLYASKEMKGQKLLHYGTIKSRSFENHIWEIKVELTERSNFRVINMVEDDDE